jgi:nucleoside-diphosphate-sugar epimerase
VKVFIFGAGYSGKAFAAATPDPSIPIGGTTRAEGKFAELEWAGIQPFVFDAGTDPSPIVEELSGVTHLVVSIAPDDGGDPVLAALSETIRKRMPRLAWIGYLSTVGVYGDHQGAWIDETAECRPASARSRRRLEAERAWLALGAESGIPVAILRLAGIYGPGRNAFVNLRDGTARRLIKKGQVFNRIHVADIAGALWHLAQRGLGGVFNVTDDLPAPPQDVVTYAAMRMGVEPPPDLPFETAELTPMARSFYGENKRVSNSLLRRTGYALRYPDFHTAFDAMWADGSWRGDRTDGRRPIRSS